MGRHLKRRRWRDSTSALLSGSTWRLNSQPPQPLEDESLLDLCTSYD